MPDRPERVPDGVSLLESHSDQIVVVPGGCWVWIGVQNGSGYGQLCRGGRMLYTHRLEYECARGKIPDGLEIDHLCRVPGCVNPDHMEAVTPVENVMRGHGPTATNARKVRCKRGHALSGPNLYVTPSGYRNCKRCKILNQRRLRARALLGGDDEAV